MSDNRRIVENSVVRDQRHLSGRETVVGLRFEVVKFRWQSGVAPKAMTLKLERVGHFIVVILYPTCSAFDEMQRELKDSGNMPRKGRFRRN